MSDEEKPTDRAAEPQNIRYDMVNTALYFLLNPGVMDKPDVHKIAFLKNKGVTDAEISLAYKRAESNPRYKEFLKKKNASNNSIVLPPPVPEYEKSVSVWSQINRYSSSVIVLGVALFGAHYIYKTYIEPLIFGEDSERKKSQKLDEKLFEMANSLSELERHVSSLEESITCQKGQIDKFFLNEDGEYYPTPLALRELKSEIGSVKSLLLSRHQFPALPKVTPTIPQWQLPSKEISDNTIKQNGEASEHQYSDEHTSTGSKSSCESNSEEEYDDDDDASKQTNSTETIKSTEVHDDASKQTNSTEIIKSTEVQTSQYEHSEELTRDSIAS